MPCPCRAAELQFYTSAAAVAMLVPAWIFFMVSFRRSATLILGDWGAELTFQLAAVLC